MTDYYVDSNTGSDSDTGLTQALAFATIDYAVGTAGIAAGDIIWVRRTHVEYSGDPTSHIAPAAAGTRSAHKSVIGWPRAALPNTTITSASWTNGSTTVDLVVGVTLSRGAHCGRWITAPNSKKFLITQITDSNTLVIDREYSGATVTLTNGKFQIEADEDYATKPADVDGWDSDADALPVIDFRDTAYGIFASNMYCWTWKNLEIRDTIFSIGAIYLNTGTIIGCLLHNDNDQKLCQIDRGHMERCILEGSGAGGSQNGITAYRSFIKDVAVYNMGNYGISMSGCKLENVNIGVEVVNQSYDILYTSDSSFGRDVKLGSTNKFDLSVPEYYMRDITRLSIENYQKILGEHKTFFGGAEIQSADVVADSGDPYKRSDGADKIIELDCSNTDSASVKERAALIFTHEFETDTTSRSYRYYVQCKDLALSALELWLECDYVDSYDDTSEYTITKVESDEACTIRSGVSDWDQYIEVTGIQPAIASKVRIKCFVAKYDADGYIYIDPQVVVS